MIILDNVQIWQIMFLFNDLALRRSSQMSHCKHFSAGAGSQMQPLSLLN